MLIMLDLLVTNVYHVLNLMLIVYIVQQLVFAQLAKIVIIYTQICVMQIA